VELSEPEEGFDLREANQFRLAAVESFIGAVVAVVLVVGAVYSCGKRHCSLPARKCCWIRGREGGGGGRLYQ